MAIDGPMDDALLLIRGQGGDPITAAVTSVDGWQDYSELLQYARLADPVEVTRLAPHGGVNIGEPVAGLRTPNGEFRFGRQDGKVPDPGAIFGAESQSKDRRFQFVFQIRRSPLVGNDGVLVPAPSLANPQYTGTAVMEDIDPWGEGPGSPILLRVPFQCGRDFRTWLA